MNTLKKETRFQSIFYTTIVLTLTTLSARTIVVYYNVYLSGKIGTVGIGIFELIMSVYVFAKTASTAGVSLASTRMSAECTGDFRAMMRRIVFCCFSIGAFCGSILFSISDLLCRTVLDNPPGGVLALQILAFSLPFLATGAAHSGFFLAKGKMRRYAPIQITEQVIRVALTIAFLEKFSSDNLSYSICAIALAITVSEVVACLFSSIYYLLLIRKAPHLPQSHESTSSFLRSFFRLVFPVGGGALFRASLNTVYNILVPFGLKKSGASAMRSLASYGIVQGMALPILLYPSAVMGVVALQMVPEIAALRAQDEKERLKRTVETVLKWTLLFSIICAGILFFFAEELSMWVFRSSEASFYIRTLAPLVPVMYLDTVSDGILKGLDLQMKVLGIGIIDSLLSLALIYFLLPSYAIAGYLFTIYAGECINTFLGQLELRRHIKLNISFLKDIGTPVAIICFSCFLTKATVGQFADSLMMFPGLCALLAALCMAIGLLCLTKNVKAHDLYLVRELIFDRKHRKSDICGFFINSNAAPTRTTKHHANDNTIGNKSKSET